MDHSASRTFGLFIIVLLLLSSAGYGQNVYELRQYTDEDWQRMSTSDRLEAINTSNNHVRNQTFLGNFNRDADLYPQWGSDYYEMSNGYENYSFRGFENYSIVNDRRQRWYYNQFGDRLTRMTRVGRMWTETVNDDGSWGTDDYSSSGGGGVGPNGYVNAISGIPVSGLYVARESTDDWAVSLIGGGSVRKKISPLTFSLPNIDGMVADFQSNNTQASFVNYAMLGVGAKVPDVEGGGGIYANTLMLRAGQVRRKFGALTLGFNYANMYQIQPNRDGGHSFEGAVNDISPTSHRYLVRITDDSPYDGDGPSVHDVRLYVNGRERPDIIPSIIKDDTTRDLITAMTSDSQKNYLDLKKKTDFAAQKPNMDAMLLNERLPKFVDYLYFEDYQRGRNAGIINTNQDESDMNIEQAREWYTYLDPTDAPFQVNGTECVVYMFDISGLTSERINSVRASVTVENDYRIQVSEIYQVSPSARESMTGEQHYKDYGATFWKTMAQADGNIKDGSNLRTVQVDFAYEVANTMYGMDIHFNYLGFKIDGEYVVNTHHYQFADGMVNSGIPQQIPTDIERKTGERSSLTDNAYYFVAQKEWSQFGFAGEFFRMGKFYRPDMNYFNRMVGKINQTNYFTKVSMIADNDDDDQYPDAMPASSVAGYRFATLVDPDGVFPGKDEDRDGIPDTDKNLNYIVDYNEPFMMFDSDPDAFVFGDDFNNNTVPDFQEDDVKYDTPYDLDRKGYHLNLRYSPQDNINLFVGSLKTNGVGVDNRTYNDYFKANFTYNVLDIGNIFAEYRYEKIKDNIVDSYMITDETKAGSTSGGWGQEARYISEQYFDEREYRNSNVNRLFLEALIRPVSSVTVHNHVRYENNAQVEGTMYDSVYQTENTISTLAMTNKVVYTKQMGNFTFSPGIKFRFYKKDYEIFGSPRDHYLMTIPLVYLKYRVSEQTNITFGVQGFKGLDTRYEDYVLARDSYKQRNMLLQIENSTNYFGFDVWGAAGFQSEQIVFDEVFRKFEEYKSTSLFVRMWLGY